MVLVCRFSVILHLTRTTDTFETINGHLGIEVPLCSEKYLKMECLIICSCALVQRVYTVALLDHEACNEHSIAQ